LAAYLPNDEEAGMMIARLRIVRGLGIAVAGLIVSAVFGASVAWAANPAGTSGSFAGCTYYGQSEFYNDTWPYDYAQTSQDPYTYCYALLGVYAYFWGSDYQYHFRDGGWISGYSYAANSVLWEWWTDDIYGYHQVQEPAGTYSTKLTTHAY
jgi:hypothetical protein